MSEGQRAIRAIATDQSLAGHWRVTVRPPGGSPEDISVFRGMPTTINDFSFNDPFGPDKMGLDFPMVSIFDARGAGDLKWAVKGADVDVIWVGDLPASYPFGTWVAGTWVPSWRWEGYITTFSWSSDARASAMSVQVKGAGYQLDNWLAKPEYLGRPIPYEWAIARQYLNRPSLRLNPLKIIWPSWWDKQYTPKPKGTPTYMIPAGVTAGSNWSALVTRDSGSWNPVLTGYIQGLLASMYTPRGRWTIDLQGRRQPVMQHRDFVTVPDASTVVIDPVLPDNVISLSEDWEQSMTTVYGSGTSLSGTVYTGMQVSNDGSETFYVPLASSRQTYPDRVDNNWYDPSTMVKEVTLQMQSGLDAIDAAGIARSHLATFAEPGLTGTVTIGVDPLMNGVKIPRHLVRAGMTIHIPRILGRPNGVLLHVSSSSSSFDKTTLTVDSKFRDALTVDEVRLRGRDALSVSRMLTAGNYKPAVDDMLFPWSYAEGSGFVPSNDLFSSVKLFRGMPNEMLFPWEDWTVAHPPKDARWRNCYVRIGPRQLIADKNWATQHNWAGSNLGTPIRMSQQGSARLFQFAAYDKNGHVMAVPFHVSFYAQAGVNVQSMPNIPANQVSLFPPYQAGQKYPFVRDGWEEFNTDGTHTNPNVPHPTKSVEYLKGWGNFYEKAGYYPGSYGAGDAPTGMLVDEGTWEWNPTGGNIFNQYNNTEKNLAMVGGGLIYMMVYCDAQTTNEVFFLGRVFRAEPTGGNT